MVQTIYALDVKFMAAKQPLCLIWMDTSICHCPFYKGHMTLCIDKDNRVCPVGSVKITLSISAVLESAHMHEDTSLDKCLSWNTNNNADRKF